MLTLNNIQVKYGNVLAIEDISIHVNKGELVSIIGSNGAGKSTLLKSIVGAVRCQKGQISFKGKDITKFESHRRVGKGISLVPEGRHVFPDMTVLENLQLGFSLNKDKGSYESQLEKVYALFPLLKERTSQLAGSLSGGQQQMLAIGRGLMLDPEVIMLDEPSLGLAPVIVQEMMEALEKLNESGLTILLIEQNAIMALNLCDRAYVLETGKVVLEGAGKSLLEDGNVQKAYLGI